MEVIVTIVSGWWMMYDEVSLKVIRIGWIDFSLGEECCKEGEMMLMMSPEKCQW